MYKVTPKAQHANRHQRMESTHGSFVCVCAQAPTAFRLCFKKHLSLSPTPTVLQTPSHRPLSLSASLSRPLDLSTSRPLDLSTSRPLSFRLHHLQQVRTKRPDVAIACVCAAPPPNARVSDLCLWRLILWGPCHAHMSTGRGGGWNDINKLHSNDKTHTHTHTHSHSHTHSHTLTHSHSLTYTLTHSLTHSLTHTHTLTLTHTYTHSLSLSLSFSLSLCAKQCHEPHSLQRLCPKSK